MSEKFYSSLDAVPKRPKGGIDVTDTKEKDSLCDLLSVLDTEFIEKIMSPENFLGEGVSKQVYLIPNLPDLVLYVIKKEFIPGQPIMPFEKADNFIDELNYGQTVAVSPSGVGIMKRVYGSSHGVDVWIKKMKNFNTGLTLEVADAIKFYNQIKVIASYPIEAYKKFAYQLKILNKNKIRIDSINPNNVMVDDINKTFCIIDFEDINERHDFTVLPDPLNGVYDMRTLLSDGMLNLEWLRILPQNLQDSFIKYIITILEKCKIAASSVNLYANYDCTIEFFKMLEELHGKQAFMPLDRFNDFLNYYKTYEGLKIG